MKSIELTKNNFQRITPAQTRAARALLDWSQDQLSAVATVSISALRNFEAGRSNPTRNNLAAIRVALEAAGVQFIDRNGGGPGVRLRDPGAPDSAPATIPLEDLNAENDE
jgi:transcriptional regulator with XRE-family HTH domain